MLPRLSAPIPLVKNCELPPPDRHHVSPYGAPGDSVPHPVCEGENLVTIANRPDYVEGVTHYRSKVEPAMFEGLSEEIANARALIHFNFGTTVPEYVNWYLLNLTCCYHATEDKCNRRFSNYDASSKSPAYGTSVRAGKIYVPTVAVKPKPKVVPDVRPVRMWASMAFQDGLFSWLNDLAKARGAGTIEMMLEVLEDAQAGRGTSYTTAELRKLAKLRRFAKPLRWGLKAAKRLGWAATIAELILGGRVVHGFLAMSYEDEHDTHYGWEVDMVLKGPHVFTDRSGSFTTKDDKYSIRTSVFNPEKWGDKDLKCMMTGSKMALAIERAFRHPPHAGKPHERPFTIPGLVMPQPGPLDWTVNMVPNHSLGGGLAVFSTIPGLEARLSNGKRRSLISMLSV